MTATEARQLARTVVKSSNARVKFGETNGRQCLHILEGGQSETIYAPHEWDYHRWNSYNRPKDKEPEYELKIAHANANKSFV